MDDEHDWTLEEALYRAAEYGVGTVLHIPERAHIQLAEGTGHLLAGATITFWGGDRMTPTVAEQREQFDEWFYGLGHQAYLAKVAERGGTPLDDPEAAFETYRRRWTQPQPPTGLTKKNLRKIRRHDH